MKSLLASTAVAAAALALAPAAAHAGTYIGLGIGTSAHTDGAMAQFGSDSQHSGRAVLGYRFGQISVEGGITDYGLTTSGGRAQWNAMSLGVAGVLHLPLTTMLEGYVRAGVQQTSIKTDASGGHPMNGDGWMGGLGLEYRLNMLVASASVWIDYSREATTFGQGASQTQGTANMWTVGLTFGL